LALRQLLFDCCPLRCLPRDFREFSGFRSLRFAIILKSCRTSTQEIFFFFTKRFLMKATATEMISQSNSACLRLSMNAFGL
jgi:hypothetical protein